LPPDRERPRANLYNVVKRLRENRVGYNHTLIVAKLNEMQMKNKHEEIIGNFFHGIQRDMQDEFSMKVTGYCLIYAPYYICFLETDDGDFSDYVLREI